MSKVGYCNPPIHTRFKPGQSGNPSGRPKGSKNFSTQMMEFLLTNCDSDFLLDEEIAKSLLKKKPFYWNKLPKRNLGNVVITETILQAVKGNVRAASILFKASEN